MATQQQGPCIMANPKLVVLLLSVRKEIDGRGVLVLTAGSLATGEGVWGPSDVRSIAEITVFLWHVQSKGYKVTQKQVAEMAKVLFPLVAVDVLEAWKKVFDIKAWWDLIRQLPKDIPPPPPPNRYVPPSPPPAQPPAGDQPPPPQEPSFMERNRGKVAGGLTGAAAGVVLALALAPEPVVTKGLALVLTPLLYFTTATAVTATATHAGMKLGGYLLDDDAAGQQTKTPSMPSKEPFLPPLPPVPLDILAYPITGVQLLGHIWDGAAAVVGAAGDAAAAIAEWVGADGALAATRAALEEIVPSLTDDRQLAQALVNASMTAIRRGGFEASDLNQALLRGLDILAEANQVPVDIRQIQRLRRAIEIPDPTMWQQLAFVISDWWTGDSSLEQYARTLQAAHGIAVGGITRERVQTLLNSLMGTLGVDGATRELMQQASDALYDSGYATLSFEQLVGAIGPVLLRYITRNGIGAAASGLFGIDLSQVMRLHESYVRSGLSPEEWAKRHGLRMLARMLARLLLNMLAPGAGTVFLPGEAAAEAA